MQSASNLQVADWNWIKFSNPCLFQIHFPESSLGMPLPKPPHNHTFPLQSPGQCTETVRLPSSSFRAPRTDVRKCCSLSLSMINRRRDDFLGPFIPFLSVSCSSSCLFFFLTEPSFARKAFKQLKHRYGLLASSPFREMYTIIFGLPYRETINRPFNRAYTLWGYIAALSMWIFALSFKARVLRKTVHNS